MPSEKALALVVRGTDWSETSRIATLWTREFGKVRALAKGGRRLKSSFEVAFDLLTVCHIVVIRKHTGGLDLLTEAQVAERFPHLRTDLQALYAGYYVAELLADGTQDYDPHPALFDAALDTLRGLAAPSLPPSPLRGEGRGGGDEALPPTLTLPPKEGGNQKETLSPEGRENQNQADIPGRVSAFELAWLRELGYSPRLDDCAGCGNDLSGPAAAGARVGYGPSAGGVLCPACLSAARDHRLLSGAGWAALRGLAGGAMTLPAAARAEVRQTLGQTVSAVLGRRPRLLGYLDGG
ncbi:MAG TPA: DNA repair protein RecO [Fimbriiglobus sp.]|nr:DNA repair protein RecO [Fimbriiglobus sp.]